MLLEPGSEILKNRIKLIYKNSLIAYAEKSVFYTLELLLIQKIYDIEDVSFNEVIKNHLQKSVPKQSVIKGVYYFLGNAFLEQYLGNYSLAKSNLEKASALIKKVDLKKLNVDLKKSFVVYGLIVHKLLESEDFLKWQSIRLEYSSTNPMIDVQLLLDEDCSKAYKTYNALLSFQEDMLGRACALTSFMIQSMIHKSTLFGGVLFTVKDLDIIFWNKDFSGPYIPDFSFKIEGEILKINLDYQREIPKTELMDPFLEPYFTIFDTIDAILNQGIIKTPFFEGDEKDIYNFLKRRKNPIFLEIGANISQRIDKVIENKLKKVLVLNFKWINKKNELNLHEVYYKGKLLNILGK